MPPKHDTLNIDRIRVSGPWTAWWAVFIVLLTGVWYLRGAKGAGEQLVKEVKEIRVEMREFSDKIHSQDVRITTLEEWKRSKQSTGNNW